jgi:hypothetical protein
MVKNPQVVVGASKKMQKLNVAVTTFGESPKIRKLVLGASKSGVWTGTRILNPADPR